MFKRSQKPMIRPKEAGIATALIDEESDCQEKFCKCTCTTTCYYSIPEEYPNGQVSLQEASSGMMIVLPVHQSAKRAKLTSEVMTHGSTGTTGLAAEKSESDSDSHGEAMDPAEVYDRFEEMGSEESSQGTSTDSSGEDEEGESLHSYKKVSKPQPTKSGVKKRRVYPTVPLTDIVEKMTLLQKTEAFSCGAQMKKWFPKFEEYDEANKVLLGHYNLEEMKWTCAVCPHNGKKIKVTPCVGFHRMASDARFKTHWENFHKAPVVCDICKEEFEGKRNLNGHKRKMKFHPNKMHRETAGNDQTELQ